MNRIEDRHGDQVVSGTYADGFEAVADEFVRNLTERGEVGASAHAVVAGETVVDLWGGTRDRQGTLWDADTMVVTWSCTKGATAICAHVLVDRGLLDLDAPVGDYWPEFATNGKEQTTVRMMLDHSAGVAALRAPVPAGGYADWDLMCEMLAAEEPWWEPGTRNGYHMLTFGWTVGELVRRVSGVSLGTFLREEVTGPLDADFYIGLPAELEPRVAASIAHRPSRGDKQSGYTKALLADRDGLQGKAWFNMGGFEANDPAAHAAEVGGGGGIGSARGLARMYAPLANSGEALGVRLVAPEAVAVMSDVAVATHVDAMLMLPTRFGLGFMKSMDNRRNRFGDTDSAIIGRNGFGHVGAGGSIGFADPDHGLSFGYAMNRMGPGLLLNERGQSLVDATYASLGA